MTQNTTGRCALVASAMIALAGGAAASDKVIATFEIGSIVVPTNTGATVMPSFAGLTEPVTGVGLSGTFVVQSGDFKDGLGPWSLDVILNSTPPAGGSPLVWHPIGGDVTIADYPLQDGTDGLASVDGNGTWTFDFQSDVPMSSWTYRIDDAVVYLLADAEDITTHYDATPEAGNSWSRPYFIAGVSGLGPVAYHAFEFTVSESGVYDLTSVHSTGGDHFTFLYEGGFDSTQPLNNLLDYGLGNGNSPFGAPRGTSEISALLFEGTTYTWVTSQWSAGSTIAVSANTIVGPGELNEAGQCLADTNGDGVLSPADFSAWVAAFNAMDPACDQNGDGSCTPADFSAWVANFNAGCP